MNQPEDTIVLQLGECLRAALHYRYEDGAPIDLTNKELSISSASHSVYLSQYEFHPLNLSQGKVLLHIPADSLENIPFGRSSWMRIASYDPTLPASDDLCRVVFPKFWVEIQ